MISQLSMISFQCLQVNLALTRLLMSNHSRIIFNISAGKTSLINGKSIAFSSAINDFESQQCKMNLLILGVCCLQMTHRSFSQIFLGYYETSSTNPKLLIHIFHQTFRLFKISYKTLVTKVCNNGGNIKTTLN